MDVVVDDDGDAAAVDWPCEYMSLLCFDVDWMVVIFAILLLPCCKFLPQHFLLSLL